MRDRAGQRMGDGENVAVGVGVPGAASASPVETFQLEDELLEPELPEEELPQVEQNEAQALPTGRAQGQTGRPRAPGMGRVPQPYGDALTKPDIRQLSMRSNSSSH